MKKRLFSGVQPTGRLHLGNYLGALKQWLAMQKEMDSVFCIVDLHAITAEYDPKELKDNIYKTAAVYLAAGIDPEQSTIFVQSTRPEHSELAWLLNCLTKIGELSRMTQFKDKSQKGSTENSGVGLFDYPVLMAADILLYNTTDVPVGEDQKQHVELARDLAIRFNKKYGETFIVPELVMKKTGARIMGLDDPIKKMSKSAASALNYIALDDSPETISNKIKKAVTDSGTEIISGPDKPAINNLLNIYSEITGKEVTQIEAEYKGRSYSDFKEGLSNVIIEFIGPFQEKYNRILSDRKKIKTILDGGSRKAEAIAKETLAKTKQKMGLGL
ncbi:MAG: tryptophan--tRNA ligase [Patescibacteria group bacterium]